MSASRKSVNKPETISFLQPLRYGINWPVDPDSRRPAPLPVLSLSKRPVLSLACLGEGRGRSTLSAPSPHGGSGAFGREERACPERGRNAPLGNPQLPQLRRPLGRRSLS